MHLPLGRKKERKKKGKGEDGPLLPEKLPGLYKEASRLPSFLEDVLGFLEDHGSTTEGLFRLPGSALLTRQIKHAYVEREMEIARVMAELNPEQDRPTIPLRDVAEEKVPRVDLLTFMQGKVNPHIISGLLISYLRELEDPIFTQELYECSIVAGEVQDEGSQLMTIQNILRMLPPGHAMCLERLMGLAHRLVLNQETTKMGVENMAIVLGPVMLRNPNASPLLELMDSSNIVALVGAVLRNFEQFYPAMAARCADERGRGLAGVVDLRTSVSDPTEPKRSVSPERREAGVARESSSRWTTSVPGVDLVESAPIRGEVAISPMGARPIAEGALSAAASPQTSNGSAEALAAAVMLPKCANAHVTSLLKEQYEQRTSDGDDVQVGPGDMANPTPPPSPIGEMSPLTAKGEQPPPKPTGGKPPLAPTNKGEKKPLPPGSVSSKDQAIRGESDEVRDSEERRKRPPSLIKTETAPSVRLSPRTVGKAQPNHEGRTVRRTRRAGKRFTPSEIMRGVGLIDGWADAGMHLPGDDRQSVPHDPRKGSLSQSTPAEHFPVTGAGVGRHSEGAWKTSLAVAPRILSSTGTRQDRMGTYFGRARKYDCTGQDADEQVSAEDYAEKLPPRSHSLKMRDPRNDSVMSRACAVKELPGYVSWVSSKGHEGPRRSLLTRRTTIGPRRVALQDESLGEIRAMERTRSVSLDEGVDGFEWPRLRSPPSDS